MAKRMYVANTKLTLSKTGKTVEAGEHVDLGHLDAIALTRLELKRAITPVVGQAHPETEERHDATED